jgi:cell fate regulator YaaT (PSP1 superfamily)
MPINPLPQFEADLKQLEEDRKAYEALSAPKTIVVRFGAMKLVGEFPYKGDAKPGCGSKLVVRTHRGTELGEMLTSTCPNAGCSKSVSRKEMLEFIENSGGKDYPFWTNGRVLRIASVEDLQRQEKLEQTANEWRLDAKRRAERLGLVDMKIALAEPLLGGERVIFHYTTESGQRVDFRELVRELAAELKTRIEMHQVGARDEARLTADYERCGQYCCCKNFLKVLKPVSMRSAKTQKATLDPLKISGRCGRLMCCLRYEDETYEDLKRRLPRRKTRVGTPHGDGTVIDGQILTQLVLVRLDESNQDVAVPVEELARPGEGRPPAPPPQEAPASRQAPAPSGPTEPPTAGPPMTGPDRPPDQPPGKRRRRRRKGGSAGDRPPGPREESPEGPQSPQQGSADGASRKRRRRKRRRRPGDGGGGEGGSGGGGGGGGGGGEGPPADR